MILQAEFAAIQERQALLRAELEGLAKEAGEKEHQLAAISQQSIKEYKVIWKSYTPPNPFPCPLCFVFHKKLSHWSLCCRWTMWNRSNARSAMKRLKYPLNCYTHELVRSRSL